MTQQDNGGAGTQMDDYVYPGDRFTQSGMKSGHGMGMTLRDEIAIQALCALISKSPFFDRDGEHGKPIDIMQFKADMAVSAYGYADALLAARSAK